MSFSKIDFSDSRGLVRRVLLFFPLFAVVNIVIVYLFTDMSELLQIRKFYPGYLLLAAGIRIMPWFIKALRLKIWMNFMERRFPYREGLRISIWTELGAAVTPTAVGGGPIQIGMLYNKGLSAGRAASVTTVASVEDIVAHSIGFPLVIIAGFILKLNFLGKLINVLESRIVAFGLSLLGVMVLVLLWRFLRRKTSHPGRIRMKLLRSWVEFRSLYGSMIRRGKARFALNVFLSAIQWGGRYSITAILATGLGYHINIFAFVVIQMMVFSLMALVPTPGASGGAEGLFLLFFNNALPESAIGTVLIGWRILDFYFTGILSLIYIGIESLIHGSQPDPVKHKENQ